MSGKIFYRERTNIGEGDQAPRYVVVAIHDLKLKIRAKHLRKQELEQIAEETGAELVELQVEGKGHKLTEEEQ
jgi:hypothetical protein